MATRSDREPFNGLAGSSSKIDDPIDQTFKEEGADHIKEIFQRSFPNQIETESLSMEAKTNGDRGGAVGEFFDLAIDELASLRTRAEAEAIVRAADLIADCESRGGRVHVTGIGKSEHVARYVASLLSSTGTPAYFLHATECVHGSAGQVCASDIVIAISNSGTTPELLCAVDVLRNFGVRVVAVSGDSQSALADNADVVLYAGVDNEGGALNLVPRASILAKIYVLCALSVALEDRKGLTREQYARWHPGGALGRLARGE
jgi:arabinose-5-phosphate isomerase